MMKILFVYPDINVRGGALSYHYGLGSLSAMLKNMGIRQYFSICMVIMIQNH